MFGVFRIEDGGNRFLILDDKVNRLIKVSIYYMYFNLL